jgi:hypothetical protein
MNEHQTSRTLLKSPPELWAECSDAQSLARHLGESLGEIRITMLEPEHTVAWEGDRASGTVKLEPSGWGTRVTLTCSTSADDASTPETEEATPKHEDATPEPEPAPSAEAAGGEAPLPERPLGRLFARVMRFLASPGPPTQAAAPAQSPPEPVTSEPTTLAPLPLPPAPPPPEAVAPEPAGGSETAPALAAALDSLGQAHHRPFSRA